MFILGLYAALPVVVSRNFAIFQKFQMYTESVSFIA